MNVWKQRQLKNLTERTHPRLDALFDGVVAIAMTMMALEISVPVTSVFDWAAFILLLKEITVYLISFLALASVWSIHTTLTINTSSASIHNYILNVALMFVITVFPALTKLMDSTGRSKLLYGVYLGGYALSNANNLSVIGIYPAKKSNRVFRTKHFALMRKFRARGRPSLNDRHRLFQA